MTRPAIPVKTIAGSAPALVVFGIPNCDIVKKARAWLTDHGIDHQFHDFKKLGVPVPQLHQWIDAVGFEKLLNRRGPTWRKLEAATQASVVDEPSAINVMVANSSVIKRPVVQWPGGRFTVGFDGEAWQGLK